MTGLSLSIAPAGAESMALLAALHGECFDRPWSAVEIAKLLALPGGFALVAASSGGDPAPVGFALCRVGAGEGEVLSLGVLPAARRSGVARALLARIVERAGELGAAALFLEVAESNAAAVRLYRGGGFAVVGRRPGYYRRPDGTREGAIVMRLGLANGPGDGA